MILSILGLPVVVLVLLIFSGTDKRKALLISAAVLAIGVVPLAVMAVPRLVSPVGEALSEVQDTDAAKVLVDKFGVQMDTKSLSAVKLEDTRGFHGDGEVLYYLEAQGEKPVLSGWEALPLSEEIVERATVLTGDSERNLLTESLPLDELKGCWKLLSGEDDADGSQDAWRNWSLCLYDEEKNAFYLYRFDS